MKAEWKNAKLGVIADVQSGGTPAISNKQLWDGGIPWYSSGELNNTFTTDPARTVSAAGLEKSNAKLFPAGSLLIGMYDTAAMKMSILDRDGAFNQAIAGVKPNDQINIRFIFYALNSIKEELLGQRRGVRQKNLSLGKVRDFLFPFPSLKDQQRIVTLLDEAFDGIATAKANAEKNLQNARAIFESYLQSVFLGQGAGWKCVAFEDAVDSTCTLSYGIVQPGEEYAGGLPIVRPTDLSTKIIKIEGLKRIDPDLANSYRRTTLRGGDLLLCVRGTTGQISIASTELAGANVTRGIVPIFFERTVASQDFGYYLMRSGFVQSQIREKTYGTALQQINIGDLRNLKLPIPPKAEQEALTTRFNDLSDETQRLESIYQQKLTALDELKKSLLHRAFSGDL